ncbi:hypothetical protein EOM89_14005 [Candidatus Falkowbacteria bacterium]|nr:hypothetical protein [Candidatus Falkowbacteria bacterium]
MTPTPKTPEPAAAGMVADAPRDNWVDRYAPAAWRPYLRLARADRPIGTWLLLIPCLWGVALAAAADAPRLFDLWIVAGCTIGAFLMRGAGCTWNDITDRNFDGAVARKRDVIKFVSGWLLWRGRGQPRLSSTRRSTICTG